MAFKYITLVNTLKEEIQRWKPGQSRRLPTEQELIRKYRVSRQTVRRALSVLEEEGLILRRQGSGAYLSPSAAPAASASRTIALLVPDAADLFASRELWEIQSLFSSAGYFVQTYSTGNLAFRERELLEGFLAKPVRGILAEGVRTAFPNPNRDLYEKLLQSGTSMAFCGSGLFTPPAVPCISPDDFGGGYLLASHLISLGHKKIAGIFRLDNLSGRERYAGCLRALCDRSLSFDDRQFLWYDPLSDDVSHKLLSFIRITLPECTAVVCQNEALALQLIHELKKLGIPVPQRISVVCFFRLVSGGAEPRVTCAQPAGSSPMLLAAEALLRKSAGEDAASSTCPCRLRLCGTDAAPEQGFVP